VTADRRDAPKPAVEPVPAVRDPAGFIGSALLPAIPLGLLAAAAGLWILDEPLLVWAGLVLAGGNLLGFAGFVAWYRRRGPRRRRDRRMQVRQHGADREETGE